MLWGIDDKVDMNAVLMVTSPTTTVTWSISSYTKHQLS